MASTDVHKHTPEITTDERAELLERARALGEQFDAVGAECDRDSRFPSELVAPYKESGIVSCAVPRRFGGLGADILTTSLVGRELAKGDPGIALAFNMHQAMVGILRAAPALEEDARERLMRAVADDGAIMCGTFSEARAGLAGLADTVAVPDGDGWRLTGRKNWSTLIEGCDIVTMNATITDADGTVPDDFAQHTASEAFFIFDKHSPGVTVDPTWNTLGMRATGSHTLVLDDAYVGPDAYGGNFRAGLVGEAEWAAVLFGGVYLGLAEKAYAICRDLLERKRLGATAGSQDTEVRQQGHVQHALGEMRARLLIAERTLESTGRIAIDQREDPTWTLPVRKAQYDLVKVCVTDTAEFVTETACRLVGGAAFARGHPLERLFRDARAGNLHSFTSDQLYVTLGRDELGL